MCTKSSISICCDGHGMPVNDPVRPTSATIRNRFRDRRRSADFFGGRAQATGGSRKGRWSGSLLPITFPSRGFYFLFLGAFATLVLTFRFAVFPGGTQPHPQFSFLANGITPFRPFSFLLPPIVGSRKCIVWRSPAGAGTPGNSSPPSGRSAPGASSSRREAVSSTPPR